MKKRPSKPAVWASVAVLSLVVMGCVPKSVPRARAKLRAGDLDGADRIVRSGLAKHGDCVDLWVLRLRIDLLRGKRGGAVEAMERLEELATWREWKRVRKLVFAHTIWEALGDRDGRIAGLEEARRHPFASLKARLEQILSQGKDRERAMAAGALLHREGNALEALVRLAKSRDDLVRLEVAKGLRSAWDKSSWKLVLQLAADRDPAVREAALHAAVRGIHANRDNLAGGNRDVLALLEAHLHDPAGPVRSVAARALLKLAPERLSRIAATDEELAVRLAALRAGRKDREFLLAEARSDKPFVALRAAVDLWKDGFVGGDDVVLRWIGDGQWQVRAAACNAASSMKGSAKACKAVARGLADADRRVAAAACGAALHLGCEKRKAMSVCKSLAQGEDLPASAAAWDLARRGMKPGLARLEALASHPGPARRSAIRSLASLRKGLSAMMSCWRDGPWDCRLEAARLFYEKFRQSIP